MAQTSNPAIEFLVGKIEELERSANDFRAAVNVLCANDGRPPMYPDDGGGRRLNGQDHQQPASGAQPAIGPDRFYGKPQQTAVRDLLAIRKAAGLSAAKPVEILEGLRQGGYVVEAKTDEIALVGLRAMLRKRNNIFHKLPNGTWGLKEWYPNARTTSSKGAPSGAAHAGDRPENADSDPAVTETEASAADKPSAVA